MNEDKSQVLKGENKAPAGKIKKFLKIVGKSCLGLIGLVVILIILYMLSPTFTDFEGTVWQKYKGDNSMPKITVFAGQSAIDKEGKTITPMEIASNCSEKTLGSSTLKGDYSKGIDRPNHCVVSNGGNLKMPDTPSLDFYLLLPDGSIISLDGTAMNRIQVNINKDDITIIQAYGKAYYRIQKQPTGKKFVIQVRDRTFTSTGTEVAVNIGANEDDFQDRIAQVAVIRGSVSVTTSGKQVPATSLKSGQKVIYQYMATKHKTTKPTSCEAGNKLCGDKCIPENLTCCEQARFSKVAHGAYCTNPVAKSCQTILQPGINILKTPKELRCCPEGKTTCSENESLGQATTITPEKLAKTDALMMDEFTKRQLVFADYYKFVWEGTSADQAKQRLQQIITTIQKNNQLAWDELEQQSEKSWDDWVESFKAESDTYWDNTVNNSNNQICPSGYYLATNMLCYPQSKFYTCKPGLYLGTDKMCHKYTSSGSKSGSSSGSGTSSGSGSVTNEQCSPPGSGTYQLMCESTHQGYLKNGQCCVQY